MFNPNYNPGIYSASKIWHNTKWQALRDLRGFNITSRWIDVECGTAENPTGAKQFDAAGKRQLWIECDEDIRNADMTIMYGEESEELRGAIVEFGMTLGQGKPIYVIGNSPFFVPKTTSDAAYMHHPLVHRIDVYKFVDGSFDFIDGYHKAVHNYLAQYHTPEAFFGRTQFLNASFAPNRRNFFQKATT